MHLVLCDLSTMNLCVPSYSNAHVYLKAYDRDVFTRLSTHSSMKYKVHSGDLIFTEFNTCNELIILNYLQAYFYTCK